MISVDVVDVVELVVVVAWKNIFEIELVSVLDSEKMNIYK